jgi:dephospho-CoA kinase
MAWVFGLTGGIASGKSTVGRRFAERKVPVLDADQIARQIVEPGTPGLAALIEAFGPGILLPSGELDRKALAARVFGDPSQRATLNAITHPRIGAATHEAVARLAEQGEPLVCYEAALLIENGLADAFRPLVVVGTTEEEQLRRTRERDGATEEEARARVASQMPLAEKIRQADLVIYNEGTLEELLRRADEALDQVIARVGAPAERYRVRLLSLLGVDLIAPGQEIGELVGQVRVAPAAAGGGADGHVEVRHRPEELEGGGHQQVRVGELLTDEVPAPGGEGGPERQEPLAGLGPCGGVADPGESILAGEERGDGAGPGGDRPLERLGDEGGGGFPLRLRVREDLVGDQDAPGVEEPVAGLVPALDGLVLVGGEEGLAGALLLGVAGDGEGAEDHLLAVEEQGHRELAEGAAGGDAEQRLSEDRDVLDPLVGQVVVIEGPPGPLGPGRVVHLVEPHDPGVSPGGGGRSSACLLDAQSCRCRSSASTSAVTARWWAATVALLMALA